MKDDLTFDEAQRILALIKYGDPADGWETVPELPLAVTCAFGVTDVDGKRIQGIVADFTVKSCARPPSIHYVFTVYKTDFTARRRVYQLDVQQGGAKKKAMHAMPHQHVGRSREGGLEGWDRARYDELLTHFCSRANLTLTAALPDPNSVTLK